MYRATESLLRFLDTNTLVTVLAVGLSEWIANELQPEKNALYWLAGTFGAFAIRLALPRMKWRRSLSGWLLGTLFMFFISPSAVEWAWLNQVLSKPVSIWFAMGMTGDAIILVIGWVRGKAAENPEAAFDAGLTGAKKIYDVFGSGEGIGTFIKSILKAFKGD